MKCFLFVATIKAGNQPSVKNIFPLFFLRHFTLWMLDCQTREPNVKINLPAPKLLWRRMENIRRSFRAEWPEAVNNNNINFHRKDSPQAWRVRERCVVRTERIKMGGGFVIISVLYCTVLYCTVLYCTVLCCAEPGGGARTRWRWGWRWWRASPRASWPARSWTRPAPPSQLAPGGECVQSVVVYCPMWRKSGDHSRKIDIRVMIWWYWHKLLSMSFACLVFAAQQLGSQHRDWEA